MNFSFSSPPLFSSLFFASLFSSLLLSLHLSCLSSYMSVCRRVCLCVWCGVVVVCAVWCGTLKTPCVDSKTPPCVDSKRPRVCRQHAHMCFSICACCRHTRGRFESTHGDVFESTHGWSSSVLLTKICPRGVIT